MSGSGPPQSRPSKLAVPVDGDDHVRGGGDAPVTLVEYGDFQCPFCGEAAPLVRALRERFGPRLRVGFRHFPMGQLHPSARRAAAAAEAAARRGAFREMHDLLYANQDAPADGDLLSYADRLGLDRDQFRADLESDAVEASIRADFLGGHAAASTERRRSSSRANATTAPGPSMR